MPADSDWNTVDWPLVLKRLAVYAAWQLPRQLWRGERNGRPPGAEEVEDLVQDAVLRAFERKDEWIIGRQPDLEKLTKIMKSRISHRIAGLAALHENKNLRLEDLLDKNPDSCELSTDPEATSPYGLVPGSMMAAEKKIYEDELKCIAQAGLSSDEEALEVFKIAFEDTTKPREISTDTKMTSAEVDVIKRRISRKLAPRFDDMFPRRELSGRGRKPDKE